MRFKGLSRPCSRSTPRQSDDRLCYQHESPEQEVRAGCGLVMATGSDARVSLLLHVTKLPAHLSDLLFSWREFNIDARPSSRSTQTDGGNRNRLAKNQSRSVPFFFQFSTKSVSDKMPPFKINWILNSATEKDCAFKSSRYLKCWNIDEPVD